MTGLRIQKKAGRVEIDLDTLGNRSLGDLKQLKGQYTGAVFIVTSGPSVNDFPLERYAETPMIAVNGSIACFPPSIEPLFFLCDDSSVASSKSDLVGSGLRRARFAGLGASAMIRLAEQDAAALWESNLFLIERVNRWMDKPQLSDRSFAWRERHNSDYVIQHSLFSQKRSRIGFSRNFAAGYFSCRTIAYTAIQLACYLGFNRIIMVGMDLRSSLGNFYDPTGARERSRLDEDYEDLILPHFTWMAKRALGPDFQVFNLSLNSRLPVEVLPKISLAELDEILGRKQ